MQLDYRIEPTPKLFHFSDAFYRILLGPVRSGKSVACTNEIWRRAMEQKPGPDGMRRSRWAIVRDTYRQLKSTTIKTWLDWIKVGDFKWGDMIWTLKGGKYEIEVMFCPLERPDHIDNLLSLELTGAWVNEGRETPKSLIDALGDRVGQFPPKRDGGCTWSGVMIDSNMPDEESWIYQMQAAGEFEGQEVDPKVWAFFLQPGGLMEVDGQFILNPKAENIRNLTDGHNYYLTRKSGKSKDYIRVYYCAKYGFVRDGEPVHPEYADQVHCLKEDVNPIKKAPITIGVDFGLCYDDQTEVLTDDGFKFFKDINPKTDRVATRDPKTGLMEYTAINFKVDKQYKGRLLQWKNTEIDFCVTPEHMVPFSFRDTPDKIHFSPARWLADHHSGHHYVDVRSKWIGSPQVNELRLSEETFAEFMGWYLSDGSVDKNTNRVAITQIKPAPSLSELTTKLPGEWHHQNTGFRSSNKKLADYLRQFGKKPERFVPREIKDALPSIIKKFIAAYTMGDGHVRRRDNGSIEHTVYTPSFKMVNDLQELAQKAGWHSSYYVQKGQVSYLKSEDRYIHSGDGYRVTFKKRASRAELLRRNYSEIDYDGRVYCLNVPYHTLYVRRGGKVHWNGNTPAAAFLQKQPDGQWIWFDEITTEHYSVKEFGENKLGPYIRNLLADGHMIEINDKIWGDPAGSEEAQTDKSTCYQILNAMGIPAKPAPSQDPQLRRESMSAPFQRMIDGKPGLVICPRVRVGRKGLQGAYFMKKQKDNEKAKPSKNKYSHVIEAAEYALLGEGEGKALITPEKPKKKAKRPYRGPHGWMQ